MLTYYSIPVNPPKRSAVLKGLTLSALLSASLMLTPTGHAQECVDSDGDGWGWDGTRSCQITAFTSNASAATTSNSGALCIDSDGDGWGWDGVGSCIVGAATQTSPGSGAVPDTSSAGTGSPAAACIDSDGDGWGWDGTASCRVNTGGQQAATPAQPAPAQPASSAAPQQPNTNPTINNSRFDRQRDLVALHFDHAPDPDDGHAAVAALMIRDRLQLNVQVVAGTHGVYSRDRYVPESERLMSAVWGSEWHNAHSNRGGSVAAAVSRWTSVLAAGGDIWIAEGGPSDFTAAVVRAINANHAEFNTRQRIHLIQHSDWNEDHALEADLSYVRNNTRYVKIADGNHPNATADFRFESHNNGDFVARALASRYSNEWAVAFNYLSPSEKLDYSDAVEVLHIVGIGTSEIADVNDFGDYFF